MQNATTESKATLETLKGFIIGKMWNNDDDTEIKSVKVNSDIALKPGMTLRVGGKSIRITAYLPSSIATLKAGTNLLFYPNVKSDGSSNKREDRVDPDYSVSIMLPEAEALAMINETNEIKVKAQQVA